MGVLGDRQASAKGRWCMQSSERGLVRGGEVLVCFRDGSWVG